VGHLGAVFYRFTMPRLTNAQKQENYQKRKKEAEEGSQKPKKELDLEIRKDPAQSTTLGGSAIDHIFTRRLSHLKSVNYATCFSHKPRLTITET
jgi:hypothetical protein